MREVHTSAVLLAKARRQKGHLQSQLNVHRGASYRRHNIYMYVACLSHINNKKIGFVADMVDCEASTHSSSLIDHCTQIIQNCERRTTAIAKVGLTAGPDGIQHRVAARNSKEQYNPCCAVTRVT